MQKHTRSQITNPKLVNLRIARKANTRVKPVQYEVVLGIWR
jgi:hypothetical protein